MGKASPVGIWHSLTTGAPFPATWNRLFEPFSIAILICVAIYFLLSPLRAWLKSQILTYAITDRRALILTGYEDETTVDSFYPPFKIERVVRSDDSGDIIFERREVMRSEGWVEPAGFFGIENVRQVEHHLQSVVPAGGDPQSRSKP